MHRKRRRLFALPARAVAASAPLPSAVRRPVAGTLRSRMRCWFPARGLRTVLLPTAMAGVGEGYRMGEAAV